MRSGNKTPEKRQCLPANFRTYAVAGKFGVIAQKPHWLETCLDQQHFIKCSPYRDNGVNVFFAFNPHVNKGGVGR